MPSVFCNTCSKIFPFRGLIKKAVCSCGGRDLSAVAGRWNDQKYGWDYYTRSGGFVGFVGVGEGSTVPIVDYMAKFPSIDLKENKRIAKQLNLDL